MPSAIVLLFVFCLSALAIPVPTVRAAETIATPDFAEFQAAEGTVNWSVVGGFGGDPRNDSTLIGIPGAGILLGSSDQTPAGALHSIWQHGDLELELDFLVSQGASFGIYLQGRYGVRVSDSWKTTALTPSDCGGISWRPHLDPPTSGHVREGHPPGENASRAPGLWQRLKIEFEAPRFDSEGRKIRNARFRRVEVNGFLVQREVEIDAVLDDEASPGPVVIRGEQGGIALRSIAVRRFDAGLRVVPRDVSYRVFGQVWSPIDRVLDDTVITSGELTDLASPTGLPPQYFLVYNGQLEVPKDGSYTFTVEANAFYRLSIEGNIVLNGEVGAGGSTTGSVRLSAGTHPFELRVRKVTSAPGRLRVTVEGSEIARHELTPVRTDLEREVVPIDPWSDRIRVQRSFVPWEPSKRLYAINVGTPSRIHYTYDLEAGNILQVWRGPWLDAGGMWLSRGNAQTAEPRGALLPLSGQIGFALIENPGRILWPVSQHALWSMNGYRVEPDGQPVFLSTLSDLHIGDRISVLPDRSGLQRRIELSGKLTSWSTWVLLAEDARIVPQPNGRGWIIGDRAWYLDLPAGSRLKPIIVTHGDRQRLVSRISHSDVPSSFTYNLVW